MNDQTKKSAANNSAKTDKKSKKADKNNPIAPNTILTITIPAAEAEVAYKKALNQLKQNVTIPGFRKGQAPTKLAEEKIGEAELIDQALQMTVPDKYHEAIQKEKKQPLTHPEFKPIELKRGQDWVLEAHIAEAPQVNLKGYKEAVKAAKKEAKKHLDEQLEQTKKAMKKASQEAKKAKKNSGQSTGDTHEHDAHNHDHVPPEPTPEQIEEHQLQHIYQALIEKSGPAIPELLLKEEVRYDLNQLAQRLESMNFSIELFLKQRGMTFDQLSGQLAAEALGRLQLTFVLNAIAEETKLAVEEKEIDEQVDKIEDAKLREEQRQNQEYRALLRQTLKRRKVVDYLLKV